MLSALIQNFDTVEKAIETSADSAGSALKENERYLDSIQGKVDQFNNAMQAMWSDTLDSDLVKGFVELGTQLVKIVDAIGPLNIALIGFFGYLEKKHGVLSNLFKPAEDSLESLKKKVAKAEDDLAKANEDVVRNATPKTVQKRDATQEKVKILRTQEVDALKTQQSDLLKKQSAAQQLADMPDASEEVKKDLADINAQLDQTNKELAEAEARLAKIDKDYTPSTVTDPVKDAADDFNPDKVKNSIRGKKGAKAKRAKKLQAEGKSFAEIEADPKIQQYTKEIEEAEQALNSYNEKVKQTDSSMKQANQTTLSSVTADRAKQSASMGAAAAEAKEASATHASTNADLLAAMASDGKVASTWADVWATMTSKDATLADVGAKLKQLLIMKLLSMEYVKQQIANGNLTVAQMTNMTMTQLLGLGFKGLAQGIATATKKMWTFMTTTPVGWILMIVAAVVALGAAFASMHKSTEELQEELDGLKSDLSDIRSELDSVNSELETINDQITELLAKDSLTFAEQEELERLQSISAELEHQKELLESEEEDKAGLVGRKAARVVDSKRNEVGWWLNGKSEEEEVLDKINEYRDAKDIIDKAPDVESLKLFQGKLDDKGKEIDEYIAVISEALEGVEYGDSEESDKALDYLAELQDTYNIARGSAGAKTNAIKGVFNKGEFKEISSEIDRYVEALANGDESAAASISNIIHNNKNLVEDLEARGVEVQDAVDHFTMIGRESSFNTLENKVAEMQTATTKMEALLSNTRSMDFTSLFDDEGKVSETAIAEYFQGTSEATRAEITRLIQEILDGKIGVEEALKQFEFFSIQSSLNIYITDVQTNFKDVFTELDEADGLIDTFQELGEAIGSTAEALKVFNQAEEEMANGGRVSIQTALELMEYTDDYGSVLQVVDGKLQLVDNAEEVLIQTRIDAIKASAQASLADATNAYNKAVLATQEYKSALTTDASAEVVAKSWEKVLAAAAGLWEGIKSLVSDESWTDAYNRGYNETLSNITGYETEYNDSGLQALVDAEAEAKAAMDAANDRVNLVNQLTPETLESINEYEDDDEDDDGIDDDKEDAVTKGWEKLLAKYENKLALLSNERDLIQAEIEKAEARGGKASAKYYEDLIRNSNDEKALLEQKKAALEEYLAANAGAIDSDTWTEYNNEINETAVAIKECEVNTIEWAEAIREIDLHYFEQITDEVSRLGEELDFVNSLLEDEEVSDENGNWSSAALTRMGMFTQQMEKAAAEAAMYQDEIDDLNEAYAKGERSEEQYQEELANLVSGQQDAIQSYEDAKDSIVELNEARIDAIKEGIEKEIEAYEDLIDAKKEELDAERDLYNFRKDIKNQTKDIAALERRIASLSGSSAASDVAERRKLEAQLLEAKEGLNDTYYNHSRDAQSTALDEEAEAFQLSKERYIEQLEEQLKDAETLIENSIMDVMLNADTVYTELNELADLYGIDLSESLTKPWKDASAQAIAWKNELQTSMTAGEYAALVGEGGAITAFANNVATKLQGSWVKAQTAAQNYAGYLTGAEMRNKFTSTLTGFGNQIQNIINKWNGVKNAADAAYTAQTRKVTVGGTGAASSGSGSGSGSNGGGTAYVAPKKYYTTATLKIGNTTLTATESDTSASKAMSAAKIAIAGEYEKLKGNGIAAESSWQRTWRNKVKYQTKYYAKGTAGTKDDEWAITDEFGPELTMYATPEGTLSFMRAGSSVIPADLTANLVEWGKINPDMLNINGTPNINMISNAVNKPELNLSFDALVKAEHITEETLPAVKKLVTEELEKFTRKLNYSLRSKAGAY